MKNRAELSSRSSWFSRSYMLAFLAALIVYCRFFHFNAGCTFLTMVFLVFLSSRIWAALSIRNLHFAMNADRYRIFPGQSITVQLSVENRKVFPVVWVELMQFFRRTSPLLPEEKDLIVLSEKEALREGFTETEEICSFLKKYSLFLSGQEISCSYRLIGQRRGIRRPQSILLRTGDGMGLTQLELSVLPEQKQMFVVYPQIVPVNCALFLRNLWSSETIGRGEMEDPTLLKNTRPYLYGDSFKKINWRTYAMGLAMEVNVQETIRPQNAHFILDGESYQGENPSPELMEEAISLIASLIMELEQQNVSCGLSLPQGENVRPITISAFEEHSAEDLLFHLSAYTPKKPKIGEKGEILPASPSSFVSGGLERSIVRNEKMYVITRNASFVSSASLRKALEKGATVLYSEMPDEKCIWQGISLDTVKGGSRT